jgi:HAD superfamily hydrolase (TIGR01509 family)
VKAVIFDVDGVLVDSEWASAEAWQSTLARFGYQIDDTTFLGFVGTTDRSLAEFFSTRVGRDAAVILATAEEEMRRMVKGGLMAFPDTLALLDGLSVPAAVASNSDRWRLDVVLSAAGIRDRFEVSVAGDEVPLPKPAPDIYLRAADLLFVNPGECVVIEDSPTGIAAARAAGMKVVAVRRGHFPDDRLAEADLVVDSLAVSTLLSPLGLGG